ncbi:unnamed protein product [Oreochromis niloticus]|nr:unnamed protein product [Mustela putorius furo]
MPLATSLAIFQSCNITGVPKSTRCAILRDMAEPPASPAFGFPDPRSTTGRSAVTSPPRSPHVLSDTHRMRVVVLGAHSIRKEEKYSKLIRAVEKSFPHPNYYHYLLGNDLMLLKLNKPVRRTRAVQWLKFGNTVRDPAAGSRCLVAGWGRTETTRTSDVLMSVNVTVVDRQTCNSCDYYNHRPEITRDMICAGSDGTNVADTCQGDSGGPLLCDGVLVGVTSFGRGCGVIKKPGVYSFVSRKQLKWIKKTMKSF